MKHMKKLLALLLALAMIISILPAALAADNPAAAAGDVAVNETNFPDANFRAWVSSNVDKDNNGWLSDTERSIDRLSCTEKNVASLEGVNFFQKLSYLSCRGNSLTELSLRLPLLEELNCYENPLTSLNLGGCPALKKADCHSCQLTSLDVTKNAALTSLDCSSNQLTSLDVTWNAKLEHLDCFSNRLQDLSLRRNHMLKELICSANQLISLDLWDNPRLQKLSCGRNPLTSLDLFMIPALTDLACDRCELTKLDLSGNPALKILRCYENQLKSLDLTGNPALEILDSYNNQLSGLDVSACPALYQLIVNTNYLPCLDIRNNPKLIGLISTVTPDTGSNPGEIRYEDGKIKLFIDESTSMITAGSGIPIDSLRFPDEKFRDYVGSRFDVDENSFFNDAERSAVTEIYCSLNNIASLQGVEYFPNLTILACSDNQLTSLDLSGNPALTKLDCIMNQITRLDVRQNTALTELDCSGNQMNALNIAGCNNLSELSIYGNQLENLDVRDAQKLKYLVEHFPHQTTDFGFDYYASETASISFDPTTTFVSSGEGILIDAVNFPDDSFRKFVSRDFDTDKNSFLNDAELDAVTELHFHSLFTESLKGIEFFTELKFLDCSYNQITELDLSRNTKLTVLKCSENKLTSLDLSQNTKLTEVICKENYLSRLDVSKNTALEVLSCTENRLFCLDVSNNTALTELGVYFNQLMSLDVSKNTALKELGCNYNELTSLDVSKNTTLVNFYCKGNQLTSLDLSKNTAIKVLDCYDNQLTSLELGRNTNLEFINCAWNQLASLDLRQVSTLNYALGWYQWTGTEPVYDDFYEAIQYGEAPKGELIVDERTEFRFNMNPFGDVKEGKYYYTPILWAYYHDPQVTGGTTADSFGWNKNCTREQIVTFLWKAAGAPEPVNTGNNFTDVKSSKYYYKAVLWAVENNITGGVGDGTKFGVGQPCKREQAVTFLWKACGSPEPTTTNSPFDDVKEGKYYYKAVLWAVENKVTGGISDLLFGVGKTCTRAQIVTFLYKAMGN